MSRTWVGVIAFLAGVGVGLYAAKLYATNTITTDINSALGKVGLGGGSVQSFVDSTVVPVLVG